jgi:hypothetical protein
MYTLKLNGAEVAGEQDAERLAVMADDQVEQYGTELAEVFSPDDELLYRVEIQDNRIIRSCDRIFSDAGPEAFTVRVHYSGPHFNPVAYCNVPGCYRFEVDGFDFNTDGDLWIYADGFTFDEGLEDIKSSLRRCVGSGRIKLTGDIPPRSEWKTDVRDGR